MHYTVPTLSTPAPNRSKWLLAIPLLAVLVASLFIDVRALAAEGVLYLREAGTVGMVVFFFVYVLATIVVVPMFFLTVTAGMVYGTAVGLALTLPAAMLGGVLAVLLARTILAGRVVRMIERRPVLRAIREEVANKELRAVILSRLAPWAPFSVQNYVLGASGVRPKAMAIGTLIGILPAQILALQLGTIVEDFTRLDEAASDERRILLIVGLVAVGAIVAWLSRVARRALESAEAPGE